MVTQLLVFVKLVISKQISPKSISDIIVCASSKI